MSDLGIVTIGVTGGIGSGKSTVCETFQRLGAKWINADKLAKNLMTDDPELKAQIIKEFGADAYLNDGLLNRAFLAKEAFNKGRVEALNRLVHPKVREAVLKAVDKAREEGYEALVYEAALLLDEGRPDFLDYVVLVTADKNERVRRVANRDGISPSAVEDRMKRQKSDIDLKSYADEIIKNDGTLEELKEKAEQFYVEKISTR